MKTLAATAAILLLAGAAHGQTPPVQTPAPQPTPAPPTSGLTRDLNSGPPAPATYLAPVPERLPAPLPTTPPTSSLPSATVASTPRPSPTVPPPAPSSPPVATVPPRTTPIPVAPAIQPRAAPITPPTATPVPRAEPLASAPDRATATPPSAAVPPPGPSAAPADSPTEPPPAAPAWTVLDSAARAALPFTAELPPGFEITTGRPGPDFRIYTIRRGGQSFAMVYAGPASQFPIYSGQMIEAGGRASIVATEDGVRHAIEHLFQRPTAPQEIHVWTMSLDGADRAMAEQIAQSVDAR